MNKMTAQAYPLESKLCEFESGWSKNLFDSVSSFLPDENHPQYIEAITEFIRVDMELRFDAGDPCVAADYLTRFPQLKSLADTKTLLVFEEFRLRNISGDFIAPEVIASHYDVSISNWPNVDFENGASSFASSTHSQQIRFDRRNIPGVGESFANFRIIGKLGEGAFGTVMLAQQDDLAGRLTVLKFVPPFSDEHSFLARLQHSNIVPVYSIHGDEKFMAICMPFMGVATLQDLNGNIDQSSESESRLSVESRSLIETTNRLKEKTIESTISDQNDLDLFKKRNKLEATTRSSQHIMLFRRFAAETVLSIAEGLAYAHEHGIVHGDLKPANILISDDCEPVLLDFHLANSESEGLGSHVGGTLAYMAPEHFDALETNEQVDSRTDVYSVGVILFELVTGRLPFSNEQFKTTVMELKESRQKPPVLSNEDKRLLGYDLASIVNKCLAPDPSARYLDGTELVEDLRAHLENRPLLHASDTHLRNRVAKWSRRNPRLSSASTIGSVAAVLIAAALFAFFTATSRLATVNATETSRRHIAEFQEIRQPLTTYTYFDRAHFDTAIQNALDSVSRFGWNSPDQLNSQSRMKRLNEDLLDRERNAASELHFWISAAYQRIALEFGYAQKDRLELLGLALQHNELAHQFVESDGLKIMGDKIRYFQQHPNGKYQIDSVPHIATKLDRTIAAFLLRFEKEKSRPLWLEALEEDPTDSLDWLCLGQNYLKSGEYKNAIACFTVCIGLEPENIYPRIHRAMAILDDGTDLELAKQDLLFAMERQPEDLVVIQNLALVYGKLRDFVTAKKYYDRAIELGTTNTRVWYLRSRVHLAMGNKDKSKKDFDYFIGAEPDLSDPISWRVRGTQKIATDPRAALEDLQKAHSIDDGDIKTLNNIAHIYSEKLNDMENAIIAMDDVVKLNPRNAANLATRGVLRARAGQRTEAIADAKNSIKLAPTAGTFYRVAGIYAQTSKQNKKDLSHAFHFLRLAIARDPQLVIRMMGTDPDIEPLKDEKQMAEIEEILQEIGRFSGNRASK